MSKPTKFKGRAWVVNVPDVDTDMIFHNSHLHITEINEMAQYAFGNLDGWKDFPDKVKPGDTLITGHNFGCGSSRQQAVDCFTALGISAIVGESYGAIYFRNAVNSGMPILTSPDVTNCGIENLDEIELDLENSSLSCPAKRIEIKLKEFSGVQMDIYQSGNLFAFGKTLKN